MARVTVEDCIQKVPNRFDLIVLAAQRSRELTSGETNMVEIDNDKNPVVALREIAEAHFTAEQLSAPIIAEMRRISPPEEIPGEVVEARPVETRPAEANPAETNPVEDSPAEVGPEVDDGEASAEVAPPDIDENPADEEISPEETG